MATSTPLQVIILAAGQGKRMCSSLPKVLHPIAGKPMLQHVVETVKELKPSSVHIVYGHEGEKVKAYFADIDPGSKVNWIEQKEQLGTGHAVMQALPYLSDDHKTLILFADVPLISSGTLLEVVKQSPSDGLGLLVAHLANPQGLGRVLRNADQQIQGIVEHKDATQEQLAINEIFTGIMTAPGEVFKRYIPQLKNNNAQNEYYYTEVVQSAVNDKLPVVSIATQAVAEIQGVNDRAQLIALERYHQQRTALELLRTGVSIIDPQRIDIRGTIKAAHDVTIDVNCIFEGEVILGEQCVIGPNCYLRNVRVGNNVEIKANSVIEDATIEDNCVIGPFARIRPGTHLAEKARVGNFVEIKNSSIGQGSKVNHLSYVGDAAIGKDVNIGAGTITCNYDGVAKYKTIIEDAAFIGSNTALVAPLTIGAGATIGAGSTVTKDAPQNELTLARALQKTIKGWKRPEQKK